MVRCSVPDTDGLRALVTFQMGQLELLEVLAAVDGVHDLERSVRVAVLETGEDKVHVIVGLLGEA
jgi:hypothetical protein